LTTSPSPVPCENRAPDADDQVAVRSEPHARVPPLVSVPAPKPALLVTVSPRFTTVLKVIAGAPPLVRIVRHGPVALAMSQAAAANASAGAVARVIRAAAQQVVERAKLGELRDLGGPVLGLAEVARALVTLAASGRSSATAEQIRSATDTLAVTWADALKEGTPADWVEPMMIASAVLSAILEHVSASEISLDRLADRDAAQSAR
jgi:hypothetical protein